MELGQAFIDPSISRIAPISVSVIESVQMLQSMDNLFLITVSKEENSINKYFHFFGKHPMWF